MPKFDESVINFAVYEDGVDHLGIASATLPNLAAIIQTVSGAGIPGNVEAPVLGHYDAMTLGLNFRTTTEQGVRLSEPRRHNIDLRAAQQIEDTVSGTIKVQNIKHIMVVIPKTETGGSIAPASPTNGSGEYSVRYWATYIDGTRVREIDPLNFICYFNGTDYLADGRTALGK